MREAGRDLEELDERLTAVYAAATHGHLEPIASDLPGSPIGPTGRPDTRCSVKAPAGGRFAAARPLSHRRHRAFGTRPARLTPESGRASAAGRPRGRSGRAGPPPPTA
ncbi:MAG: DUF1707 domain-containing protein [Actinoallomurus sp.]